MIAPQNAETSAIQENYAKLREKSGKVGKIRENRENSVKFGKIQENSEKFGELPGNCRGTAGELPGNCRGTTGELPGNRKFRQKTENFAQKKTRGMGQNLPKMQFYRILMWKVVT